MSQVWGIRRPTIKHFRALGKAYNKLHPAALSDLINQREVPGSIPAKRSYGHKFPKLTHLPRGGAGINKAV